jgi:TRAP-type C4-dicarboxylate transport system permease small subunit
MTIVMTLVLTLQVVMRYVFNIPLVWSEEISIALFSWIVLLAGSMGIREGFHVSITLLPAALPERLKAGLNRIFDFAIFLFGLTLATAGYAYVRDTAGQLSAAVEYRIEFLHLAVPVCGILIALHALARVVGIPLPPADDIAEFSQTPAAPVRDSR